MWLVVMAVEFVHGTLRWIFLRPRVGDFRVAWGRVAPDVSSIGLEGQ